MKIAVLIIFVFALMRFAVALVNLFYRDRLHSNPFLPAKRVSVLIPARNEEDNIVRILKDLSGQTHTPCEILVYDDQSGDRTARLVTDYSQRDKNVRLLNTVDLPADWLGKNHACYRLAKEASGDYLLFLDADVRLGKDAIALAVNFTEQKRVGLVSVFPVQVLISIGEKMTVPVMNFILLSLLPLFLVRKSRYPGLSAANGQFMLFRADLYHKLQPHFEKKMDRVEDIAIARWFKKNGVAISCMAGEPAVTCRMYSSYREAIHGFSKNVLSFFGGSSVLAILFWLLASFGWLIILLSQSLTVFIFYIVIILFTRFMISFTSRETGLSGFWWMIPQSVSLGKMIIGGIRLNLKKEYLWKGRDIS